MKRRVFLKLGTIAVALCFTAGHTPYNQWTVYRKRHLLVGTSRADAPTYELGRRVAAILDEYLPESKARVSRAPDQRRLASLISSHQLDLALLSASDALALAQGEDPFEDFSGIPLNGLFRFGEYLLICRPDFPDRHAYLVSGTLTENGKGIPGANPMASAHLSVPAHPGAIAFAQGHPLPASKLAGPEATSEEHAH